MKAKEEKVVSVGDLVWVQTGNQHEEPGTVLEVGCERTLAVDENSDQDENEDEDDEPKIWNDGILVKLNVSLFRGTYAPQEVRAFHVQENAPKSRRSRRLVRTIVTPSPRMEDNSNSNSNNQQNDDNGEGEEEEEDKKPAAKRKRRESSMEAEPPTEPAKAKENSVTKEDGSVEEDSSVEKQVQAQISSPYFEKAALDEEITPVPEVAVKPKAKAKPAAKTAATTKTKAAAKKPTKKAEVPVESENESDSDADSTKAKSKGKTAVKAAAKKPTKKTKASKPSVASVAAEVPGGNENKNQSDIDAGSVKAKTAATTKTKAVAKKPAKKAKVSKPSVAAEVPAGNENEIQSDGDADSAKPKVKTAAAKKTKATAKKPAKKAKASKASVAVAAAVAVPAGNENQNDVDSDDENDRPFIVEYSPTGRATCRRCDQTIARASLRVSHVPLFRGKPGFRIYRHLHCALFSEDIHQAQDVGGWKKLEQPDFESLARRVEESKMELEKENEEIRPDELVPLAFQGEIRKSPPGLTAVLLPFQVEGASWMYCQEVNLPENRGGTLADEMGMGKTIQTIATILDNRPKLQHSRPGAKHPPSSPDLEALNKEEAMWKKSLDEWNIEMEMNNVLEKLRPKKMGGARAGTLVVCPVIALSQWKSEIEKFTETDTLTVGIYHGPNRAKEMPPETMQKYDIVLTTYQVMEQDFRKMVSPNKVSCPNCGAKFKVDKLPVHLKYFCGDGAQRTEAQARQQRGRDRGGGRPGGGGGKGKGKGGTKKKPPMTKEAQKKVAERKVVRVKSTAEYDSDSELSVNSDVVGTPAKGRPSRKAAVSASKLMASSVKDWGAVIPVPGKEDVEKGDESSFSSASDDDDDESTGGSSLEEIILSDMAKTKGKSTSATEKGTAPSGRKRAASEISSTDNDALNRAREKQRLALANARASALANGRASKKNGKQEGKNSMGKKMTKGKKKGKDKKFDSSSDDSSSDDEPVDPMADVDMEKLVKEAMEGSRFSVLHSFCWWRIVLDEAHFIKSRTSQTAHSAFALSGIHRWCLSGTPLQNRVGELYSLIRFLRLDPMAHYLCRNKGCDCKSIHYRMNSGRCRHCNHSAISHYSHFNKYILNPIQRDGYTGDGRRAMFTLKNEVLDKSLLRRTKESRAEDMNLPPRIVTIRKIRLHPIEEDFYNALYTQTRSSFDDYVAEGTLLNNYAHIFDLLTKMRQAVDHPYLIVYSKKNIEKRREQGLEQVANGSVDCDICHEPPTDRVLSSCCGAGVCRSCVIEYLTGAGGDNTPCPSCQAPFTIDLNQEGAEDTVDDGTLTIAPADKSNGTGTSTSAMPSLKELSHVATGSILRRINLAEYATSSKIEVLVQELIEMRQKRPGSKALVFSQFVNMLDLIRWRLHSDPCLAKMGLGVRILHGGMDVKSRDQTLKDFREDNSVRVLLMSLKSGGVALNLTVASEVFLMDNWWNPAAEMQAIDRTHRLGQYRPVRAVRFIAEGTVEERVLQLQEKKRLVFDGTVGRDAGSLKMLNVDDMKSLFA